MATIQVRLNARRDKSYTIEVRRGLLARLPRILARRVGPAKLFVITDTTVALLYGRRLLRALRREGVDAHLLEVPAGERSKNERTASVLHTKLLRRGITRESLVVALGGGVVGDLAGYVAATVLRGVPLVQVPTTLLAQVDSSVGGKVGIDHPAGKNLIGAFHQPAAVYIDPQALLTLPAAEFKNGLAEIVKIAAALDRKFFASIELNARSIAKRKMAIVLNVIVRAVGLKAAVVEKDEFESGVRKCLNLGHTVGHALEASSAYGLKHGRAVAMGMASEAWIALNMGLLGRKEFSRMTDLLGRLGLPHRPPPIVAAGAFARALARDKKADAAGPKFVLLRSIGRCSIDVTVPADLIRKSIDVDTMNTQ